MTYKPEDIKPKRYGEVEPSKSAHYWIITNDGYIESFGWVNDIDMWSWDKHVSWFIDIPGAPPDLKPLKYPENKPDEDGIYMCHSRDGDMWDAWLYISDSTILTPHSWDAWVDWFIPVRLDSEYLDDVGYDIIERLDCVPVQEKENEMDVIWETDELIAEKAPDNTRVILWHPKLELDKVGIFKDELTAFCRHWLDLQGYDVTKREPEIKACPNPECRGDVSLRFNAMCGYWYACDKCHYASPAAPTESGALLSHNRMPRKEE